ncbi:flavoprotein [Spiroplasma endosymbiont of Panzeria rudis]|uniref:flavoprotein n=1 Tax=Spiroplasma endosymbiont of Panzeria rudis TaxID=3066301 RepID=UPI0030D3B950
MKHITLIITGSIAANKALILLKQLKKEFLVDIICTKSSLHFLEDKTFSYYSEMFEQESYVKGDLITHTNLAIKTNLIVVEWQPFLGLFFGRHLFLIINWS